jgi:multiple antibiotic resistance protein
MLNLFINTFIKFFFLYTPFFVMSTFLALTRDMTVAARHRIAGRVLAAIIIASMVLFTFGDYIFAVLGITPDAFRLGAGALLFLSAVSLVRGRRAEEVDPAQDIVVVPLAIPVAVGPAVTGTQLITAGELRTGQDRLVGGAGIVLACLCVGGLLFVASRVERMMGAQGMNVISKLTGVIIAAISAQMMMAGAKNFFFGG